MSKPRGLTVLSYNIHKGFDPLGITFVLNGIRAALRSVNPDVVFLQEVVGTHERFAKRVTHWPKRSQFEHLAEDLWPHFEYGKNALHASGHHGNAILSRHPIVSSENVPLMRTRWESRGLLHSVIDVNGSKVDAFCTHFGLFEADRRNHAEILCRRIREHAPGDGPVVVAGDFNDWRGRLPEEPFERGGLQEVFLSSRGSYARTFPVWMPALKLDRIYVRGFSVVSTERHVSRPWNRLSDHAAISAVLKFRD